MREAIQSDVVSKTHIINRLSRFLGRWIRHCGWHPDWVVRLFDRERSRFDGKPVHESVIAEGPVSERSIKIEGLSQVVQQASDGGCSIRIVHLPGFLPSGSEDS